MEESCRKGLANHPDPESCVASREAAIEALTGAHAGRVLSCEIIATGVPTSFRMAEGNTGGGVNASTRRTLRSLSLRIPHLFQRSQRGVQAEVTIEVDNFRLRNRDC